LHEIYGYFVE
jgi:hypothetical protein